MKSFLRYLKEGAEIANNDIYLNSMAKSFEDKAWFVNLVPDYVDTFVDFGGGAGEFCEYVMRKIKRPMKYVVIDNNQTFLTAAEAKGFECYDGLDPIVSRRVDMSHAILNMSSVIHEVYSYSDPFYDDVGTFWRTLAKCGFGCVSIRDMCMDDRNYRNVPSDAACWVYENIFKNDRMSVRGYDLKWLSDTFEDRCGMICDPDTGKVNVKNLVHFLIKYRYGENWDREVDENYLPVSQQRLDSIVRNILGFGNIRKASTKLEFYARQWAKDLKLNRPTPNGYGMKFLEWLKTLNTHIKWFAER